MSSIILIATLVHKIVINSTQLKSETVTLS